MGLEGEKKRKRRAAKIVKELKKLFPKAKRKNIVIVKRRAFFIFLL